MIINFKIKKLINRNNNKNANSATHYGDYLRNFSLYGPSKEHSSQT